MSAGIVSIGLKARAALVASGGTVTRLSEFGDAPYFSAAGEIVWVGAHRAGKTTPMLHPRAVLLTSPRRLGARASLGDVAVLEAWEPSGTVTGIADLDRLRGTARALRGAVATLGEPMGFGALLAGRTPSFPLDLAVAHVARLAQAFAMDDAAAAVGAVRPLLGLGGGLTPSGDDLVGGAFFARRAIIGPDPAWRAAGERLLALAVKRTHAISAALLADLVAGASFAPLHELAAGLARGDGDAALGAARTLVAIGHSSGWDMLTGLLCAIPGAMNDEG